ncbi:MAG: hypothetical protein IJY93_00070 [Clostridia bacterium]|nr:hypothetical protein [Clostridia bacterium]
MGYTADGLIKSRREKWDTLHDIDFDRRFRGAVARELLHDAKLLSEVRQYPEKFIELVFVVVDKKQRTMPFFLNEVQREFILILNKAREDFEAGKIPEISLLVLKGRQQGFTTLVTAYQLSFAILNPNFQGYTLADKSDNAQTIFQNKAKFAHSQLPDILKPTEKFNNRKQLLFSKLNSSWAVDTATKDVGRSRTVNFFHGSECAFWKDGISPIQAALGEALTHNCIKIYESTANGYNDYQKMWSSGVHINCFFEWWRTGEYRLDFGNDDIKAEFIRAIDTGNDWIWERLRWLRDDKHLTLEQLYWYFNKYEKYINKDLIKQEYPCTPEEAFLLSGKNVFSVAVILSRLEHIPKPIKVGYFVYDYDGLTISNIRWVNDHGGYIQIYALPKQPEVTKYCIGGDTAGEGSDFFTAHVLDAKTGRQVAVMKHQFDPHEYTRQMYCLGKYYEDALIGIEANFDTYPIEELQRLGYTRQYVREVPDTYTGKIEQRFGFKTTLLTRPNIISNLVAIVAEHCDLINDRDTLSELLTIVKNEKGRIEAPEGGHDDQMMGLAIAHEIRHQVVFDTPEMTFGAKWHKSQWEDYRKATPEEQAMLREKWK